MSKLVKFRVGVCESQYYVVDVEAETEERAIEKAFFEVEHFADEHVSGISKSVTSVLINDKESRGFAPYVREYLSNDSEGMGDFL